MQVTKEQKTKAAELAKKHKVSVLWVNKKGEFFTTENSASLSVNGKKDDFAKINITAKVAADDKESGKGDDENPENK